jgi:hypothetical protein
LPGKGLNMESRDMEIKDRFKLETAFVCSINPVKKMLIYLIKRSGGTNILPFPFNKKYSPIIKDNFPPSFTSFSRSLPNSSVDSLENALLVSSNPRSER